MFAWSRRTVAKGEDLGALEAISKKNWELMNQLWEYEYSQEFSRAGPKQHSKK